MLESTMAAAAGGAGGFLGQLGDTLSAPRRYLWQALGMPDDGASLLNQTFGMDKDAMLTKILGFGAEAAFDPLTYAGALMGGPLAKMGASAMNARKVAPLAEEVSALAAARSAAQEGLVNRAGMEAGTVSNYADQAAALARDHDLASIAGGRTKSYGSFTDPLAESMSNAGMGTVGPDGRLVTLGEGTPSGASMRQLKSGVKGQQAGSQMQVNPLMDEGNALGNAHPYKSMQPLLPDELAHLQEVTKANVGNRWRSLRNPEAPFSEKDLIDNYIAKMSEGANATRPMPSLGMHMRDNFLPTQALTPGILNAPLPEAFSATQSALADGMARQKALRDAIAASTIGGGDYAKMAGGSFLSTLGFGSGDR